MLCHITYSSTFEKVKQKSNKSRDKSDIINTCILTELSSDIRLVGN